jgi:hypothetical protein
MRKSAETVALTIGLWLADCPKSSFDIGEPPWGIAL